MTHKSWLSGMVLIGFGAVGLGWSGCAASEVIEQDDGGPSGSSTSTSGGGGNGGSTGQGGDGGDPINNPCGEDCSLIDTPQCLKSVCNDGSYPGAVGSCVVVPDDAGIACDDGQFCTVDDTCNGMGVCTGGPQNTCGMTGTPCEDITCDEDTDACGTTPLANGTACAPTDLCETGGTCTGGTCVGTPKDCFFSPTPNECFVAQCNPMNGLCEPVIGNEGGSCTDQNDLCTENKTCASGVCTGGTPKDCSNLTQGCVNGVCDTATGQCITMPVMPGGNCAEGDGPCTQGICDMNGMCQPQAINEGMTCDDSNSCTTGETCTTGVCGGGSEPACGLNDGCCPTGCTQAQDINCGCGTNLALTATPTSNGGGSNQFGPINWNDGVDQAQCAMMNATCSQCFGWISNSTTANGAFMQYTWPSPVQVGSIYVDGPDCSSGSCAGRTLADAELQYWDMVNSQWVTITTFTGINTDIAYSLPAPVSTDQIRLFNVTAGSGCGQTSNTKIFEWHVWTGSGCMP